MYELHIIATWLHVISAVYWVGAILFILSVLGPLLRKRPATVSTPLLAEVQARVRRFVLAAIGIFIASGLFNMHYRGLMDWQTLMGSSYGQTFALKMAPVAVMFAIYFTAPMLLKRLSPQAEGSCCELENSPGPVTRVFALLHLLALACGLFAIYLGVRLRG